MQSISNLVGGVLKEVFPIMRPKKMEPDMSRENFFFFFLDMIHLV